MSSSIHIDPSDKTWEVLRKAAVKKQYQYLIPLLNEKAGFPYAIVKGEALSCQAFGRPGQRQSGDIDVLVDKQDLKKLEALLLENGFTTRQLSREEQIVARAFSHQVTPYRKEMPLGALELDINYNLIWGEWKGKKPQVSEFLARREFISIHGVEVPVLAVPDAFIHLCLHHYKDMNTLYHLTQHNTVTRRIFRDVAGFYGQQKDRLDQEKLNQWIQEYQLEPYFYYMLHLTAKVCGVPELEAWAAELKTPEGEGLLDRFGLTEEERKKWPIPFEERLDNDSVPEIVRGMLQEADQKKVEQNRRIFDGL